MPSDADAIAAETSDDSAGEARVIGGRYALRRVIGRGDAGAVYEAENTWTHRRVAVKVIAAARSGASKVERFLRDARAAAALRHPNLVEVLDVGQDQADGSIYVARELLAGEDLAGLLAREGRLDEARARALIAPVLRGLAAAHAAGVVHRDLKPSNVFLTTAADGEVAPRVIDFGLARALREATSSTVGEAPRASAYMAPEQLRASRALGPTTDVWAVGVILHQMLAGSTPFPADDLPALARRVLAGERPPLDASLAHVSASLRAVVARALEPDPERRYASAVAMLAALDPDDRRLAEAVTEPAFVASLNPPPPRAPALDGHARLTLAALAVVVASAGVVALHRRLVPDAAPAATVAATVAAAPIAAPVDAPAAVRAPDAGAPTRRGPAR